MPKIWRVYSGADGKSHIAEEPMALKPFKDLDTSGIVSVCRQLC